MKRDGGGDRLHDKTRLATTVGYKRGGEAISEVIASILPCQVSPFPKFLAPGCAAAYLAMTYLAAMAVTHL